ncbi:hypothetical protein [Ensifer adhaerens]|jgi:DHA2 family methylenomycin A resistance protein-like MFS transporter|uniref:hypothetical protein n=1 Tax=Rhizobium sp. 11_C7_N12_5 TaxID=3240770 RepID=UPI000DDDFFFF|nr:DHA2 family methylenomycin A resistance protein-like MFS transporter [Rhizobium sp. SG570]NRP87318.1 hypothetical protein [Ensifer adhaerens]
MMDIDPPVVIGAGLGLMAPTLTSSSLVSVKKRAQALQLGLQFGAENGTVLGMALVGSLVVRSDAFVTGAHAALIISACLLLAAGVAIL